MKTNTQMQLRVIAGIIHNRVSTLRAARQTEIRRLQMQRNTAYAEEIRRRLKDDPQNCIEVTMNEGPFLPRIEIKDSIREQVTKLINRKYPEPKEPNEMHYSFSFYNGSIYGTAEELVAVKEIDDAVSIAILNGDFAQVQQLLAKLVP